MSFSIDSRRGANDKIDDQAQARSGEERGGVAPPRHEEMLHMKKPVERVLLAAACALVVSGSACATTSGQNKVTVVECDDRPPTGSNIGRLRCYRRTDIEQRREQDRRDLERMQYDTARFQEAGRPTQGPPSGGGR
jgi:hypothetical protein